MDDRKATTHRTIRFGVAFVALACAFAVTISKSQGEWQFTWDPKSLFAQPELEEGAYDLSSIVVLNRVLLQLQENYVEPKRFKPRYMLASGLNEIQKSVAEIVATFDKPIAEGPDQVVLKVGDATETFTFNDIESLWEMSLKYKEIFRFIQENLDDEVDPKDIEYAAINGVLKTLDPHSVLLSPEYYSDMLEGNRGNFGGLGIVIRMIRGELTVIEPMGEDTPAGKAGILRGDLITQINHQATLNMEIGEAVDLLRGEPGTTVSLLVERPGSDWKDAKRFEMTRDEIKIESVESANLGQKIGYIRLTGFQSNTYKDMVTHLEQLEDEMGDIEGLVLDMRGNPGGLLDKAIDICDEFIDKGTVVTTVGSGRRYRKPYPAHEKGTQPKYPIAVLIDPSSASASEIVAGALKNHNRAIILGDTSFGKGSVQVLYELQDGSALKLTIAQYLTPGDISIQSVGIVPDIKLVPMTVDPEDPDLFLRRWVRRESDLSSHLDHESAKAGEKPTMELKYVAEVMEPEPEDVPEGAEGAVATPATEDSEDDELPEEEDQVTPADDPQVGVARDLLLAAGDTWKRDELMEKLGPRLDELSKREDVVLTGHLDKWGVDWTEGKENPKADLAVTFETGHPENVVQAGEELELQVTVTNNGAAPVHRIYGITESSTRRFDDVELVFGKIEPGQSVTQKHVLKVSSSQRPRHDVIDLALFTQGMEPNDEPLLTQVVEVVTEAPTMPHFSFSHAVVDDKANADGQATQGETVSLNVYVQNDGQGAASTPVAYVRNLNEADVMLLTGRVNGDRLEPGAGTTFSFDFEVRETTREQLEFEVHVFDKQQGAEVVQTVQVPYTATPVSVSKTQKTARFKNSTSLKSSPVDGATTMATVNPGDLLVATHVAGDWVRVTAENDVSGWIPKDAVNLNGDAVETPDTAQLVFSGFAPRVELDVDNLVTESSSIKINGKAVDDGAVRDVYVFVYSERDHVYESRKVAYEKLDAASGNFAIDVPLSAGMNRIKVVTRDDEQMEATDSLYVYRR